MSAAEGCKLYIEYEISVCKTICKLEPALSSDRVSEHSTEEATEELFLPKDGLTSSRCLSPVVGVSVWGGINVT